MDGKTKLILYLEILYARMSSTDNIKEIGIEYILSYQECQITTVCGFWYKINEVFSCQNDRWWIHCFGENPKVVKFIQSMIFPMGGGSLLCSLCFAFRRLLLFCFVSEWKKGERWSGAREILTRCMWIGGRQWSPSPRRRVYLSFGVSWPRLSPSFILHHDFSSPFFCLTLVPVWVSLPVYDGGTSVCSMHLQFYLTLGTTTLTQTWRRGSSNKIIEY